MNYTICAGELLSASQIRFSNECDADLELHDIALDSRKVTQKAVFCAFPGDQSDGREYIAQAEQRGAALILCESADGYAAEGISIPVIMVAGLRQKVGLLASVFFKLPSHDMQVFGVTGTNGKTTCCFLLTQALEKLGLQAAMIGTIGAGPSQALESASHTTPDAVSLQRQLAIFRDQGITQVCMEVSSHALEQGRVTGVQFFCTLFTNLSQDHLDYHGTMQAYGAAKQRLFSDFHSDLSIINVDDAFGAQLSDVIDSDFIASYSASLSSDADVRVASFSAGEAGLTIEVESSGVDFALSSSLIGLVNIPNLMLLTTTLLALSTSVSEIQAIVSQLQPAPGRMELFHETERANVVVDYAHTPDALEKALVSVREHCVGQLWCVFGCGGDRDRSKRALMGKVAEENADRLIITNDNPRSESPETIAKDIRAGINGEVFTELDRAKAIHMAILQAHSDDWVVVAGKGHETTQTIGTKVLPFSDREQVLAALQVAA